LSSRSVFTVSNWLLFPSHFCDIYIQVSESAEGLLEQTSNGNDLLRDPWQSELQNRGAQLSELHAGAAGMQPFCVLHFPLFLLLFFQKEIDSA
jgi:hypothetical protein